MFYIAGFYKFKKILNIKKNKYFFKNFFMEQNAKGTLIISKEGINGTISAKKKNLDLIINQIKRNFNFANFDSKSLSKSKFQPFHRAKIKIKLINIYSKDTLGKIPKTFLCTPKETNFRL